MDSQSRYDAYLAAIPVLFVVGGSAAMAANGTTATFAATVTAILGAGVVGRVLFVSPPTEPGD